MSEVIKLKVIKATDGFFVKEDSNYTRDLVKRLQFDKIEMTPTHKAGWFKTKTMKNPMLVVVKPKTIRNFQLKDSYTATKSMPSKVKKDFFGDDYYEHELYNLYSPSYDEESTTYEPVELEQDLLAEVQGKIVEHKMCIPVYGTWGHRGKEYSITNTNIKVSTIDDIITPDLLKDSRPCQLSSEDSYKVIRAHIKDNIDPKVAQISNDYDFCLTVEKRVPLNTPNSRKERKYVVYATSPLKDGKPHRGYRATPPFEGSNALDLQKNIYESLTEIMVDINKPMAECSLCDGCGVIES